MADLEGNQPLAAEQYRELLSLWCVIEDRCSLFRALFQLRDFMPTGETA
jgi:hypothetical protein